jgi:hypothetical protein
MLTGLAIHLAGKISEVLQPRLLSYTGVLDETGFARIDGLPAGECRVSFPLIDKREWSKDTSRPPG